MLKLVQQTFPSVSPAFVGLLLGCYLLWAGDVLRRWRWQWQPRRLQSLQPRHWVPLSVSAVLRQTPPTWRLRLRRALQLSRLLALALLTVALLRPQTSRPGPKLWSRGVDIMLVLDTSGSMQALDLDADRPIAQRRSRLQVVQDVVSTFVEKRPHDQLGMVVFGAEAFTQCPLTLDHSMLKTFLERIQPGMAGDTTAIGAGIAAAINRLRRSSAKEKVMILLTDGSNNAGSLSPAKAATLAASLHMKIYTIGAGSHGPAPFLQDSLFGKQVQYFKTDLDEPTLQDIAQRTGGTYFRAADSQALQRVYTQIDQLEKTDLQQQALLLYEEHFAPWVLLAMALILLEDLALRGYLRRLP